MPVNIKIKDSTMTVLVKGEIDHHTAPDIRETIDDAIIVNDSVKKIILDFSEVSFMDSSGVGLVMGRYRIASGKGKKMELNGLGERDFKIMKMSGIEKLMPISKKEDKRRIGEIV